MLLASFVSIPLLFIFRYLSVRPKKITRVSANMQKKNRVGRSENLFIFCLIFVC